MPAPYDQDRVERLLTPPPLANPTQGKGAPYDRERVERMMAGGDFLPGEKPIEKPSAWTQSIVKTATGKSISERVNPFMDTALSALEEHIPQHWKDAIGPRWSEYSDATARALAHAPAGISDFITSPIGIMATVANFTPAGPAVDVALAGWQGVDTAKTFAKGYDELKQQGYVSPETFADGVVGTLGSLAMLRMGKDVKVKTQELLNYTKGFSGTQRRQAAIEYLLGKSPAQRAGSIAKDIFREGGARAAINYGRAVNTLYEPLMHVESLPEAVRMDSFDRLERAGRTPQGTRAPSQQATPELQKAADLMTDLLDKKWNETVQLLGNRQAGVQHFYVNYMPRYFKEHPTQSQNSILGMFSQRPYTGSQSFRHQRTILGPLKDVLVQNPNLHLVSSNWVELGLMKLQELEKFNMALRAARELKSLNVLDTVEEFGKIPAGWDKINDRIIPKAEIPSGRILIAPEHAAKAINNYLSPSMESRIRAAMPGTGGNIAAGLLRGVKGFNNNSARFLVSWSLFHPILSASLSMTDAMALAPMYASRGRWKQAGSSFAKAFTAPVEDWRRGSRLIAHAKDPSKYPVMAPYLEALEKGGGRAGIDTEYRSRIIDGWFKQRKASAIRNNSPLAGKVWNMMESMNNYVMHVIVPNLKAGAFMRLADYEMDKMGPNWRNMSLTDQRAAFGKAHDSIDNRHGQLVYDNMFIPRLMKDTGFLGLQFMGWTVGTYREGIGAWKDVSQQLLKAVSGQKPELTHRIAWMFFGLPVVAGMTNGILNWLMTGEHPSQKDLIAPRTGKKNADGTEERITIAPGAYLRTYQQIGIPEPLSFHGPESPQKFGRAVMGRASSGIMDLYGIFTNRDFEGRQITYAGHPLIENMARELYFVGGRMIPITAQNVAEYEPEGLNSFGAALASEVGVRRASAETMRSDAQNLVIDYSRPGYRQGPFPEEEFDKKQESRTLSEGLQRGTKTEDDVRTAARNQEISVSDAKKIIERYRYPSWHPVGAIGSQFARLNPEEMFSVWRSMTPEERDYAWRAGLNRYVREKILLSPKNRQEDYSEQWRVLVRSHHVEQEEKRVEPPEVRR